MNQEKNLVLFTTSYPYGKGESFLEAEINYLSEQFDKVIIFPIQITSEIRKTPSNVTVNSEWNKIRSGNNIAYLKVLFQENLYKNLSFSWKFNIRLAHYIAIDIKFQKVISYLEDKSLIDSSIFYTYWLAAHTVSLAFMKRKFPRLKVVTRVHGIDLYEERSGIKEFPFRRIVLDNLNLVFSISKDGINHINRKYGTRTNLALSRLGTINPKTNNPISAQNKFHVVSCAFLRPLKRIDLLIEALGHFNKTKFEITWSHIGGGDLLDTLKDKAEKELIQVQYNFKGNMSNKDIFYFYKNTPIDLFTNVSEYEGIPVSIMEAQSFGIPVLATDVGGVSEIVNNINGFLIEKDISSKELFEKMLSIFENKPNLMKKRELSKINWLENYDADKNYESHVKLLKSL